MPITDKLTRASNGTRPIPTTTTATRAVGATTISCGALTGWNIDGLPQHFIIYTIDTNGNKMAGSQLDCKGIPVGNTLTQVQYIAGSDNGNSVGAVVEAAPTAAYADGLYSWGTTHANPDGTLIKSAVQTALGITADAAGGWDILNSGTAPTVASGYNKGNKEFDVVYTGVDLTSVLSVGMRHKINRSGTTPTMCLDLESTSSQYASKTAPTGITFTDDFTIEAWIKLESYPSGDAGVVERRDANNGWGLRIKSTGQLDVFVGSAGNFDVYQSYQSLPLGVWTHIAVTVDASTNISVMYMNGIVIPTQQPVSATTALVQAGN